MLVIRLRRIGKKSQPTYRISVAEHSDPVNGQFKADLGYYNPHTKALKLEKSEVVAWLNKGAQPSNSVAKLLEKDKIKHKLVVVIKRTKKAKKEAEKEVAKTADKAVVESAEKEIPTEITTDAETPTIETKELKAETEESTDKMAEAA